VEEKNLSEEGILCSEMLALHFQNDTTAYCIERVPVPSNGSNPTPTVYIKKSNNCGSSWQQTDVITFSGLEECDMQFVNDTLGYAIIGKKLLKIPALPGSINPYPYFPNGITNMNSNKLILQNISNNLLVKSASQPIVCIEIADITGHTILRNNYSDNYSEVSIVLPQFQSNICLIKVTLSNHESYKIKWIKH
jgi:hypothetical protein